MLLEVPSPAPCLVPPSSFSTAATLRGGGYRESRIKDPKVKAAVKARADGTCCWCGDAFTEDETDDCQICHVHMDSLGGSYTTDNLVYGHRRCDGEFDGRGLILDPRESFGYWTRRRIQYSPDEKQVRGISPANIRLRWDWVKEKFLRKENSDEEFRVFLVERGYTYHR